MPPDDLTRLRHMLEASTEATTFIRGQSRISLDHDRKLVLALVKELEIIGEAASRLTAESRSRYPDLPWTDIVGMRNRLIHAYFDVDLDVLWSTVTEDLPPLVPQLEDIVLREERRVRGN